MKRVINMQWAALYLISALFLVSIHSEVALAQANPCAAKVTKGGQNPCAVNPCAPGGKVGAAAGKAVTVVEEVIKVDSGAKKIILKRESGQLDLDVGAHAIIREGARIKSLKDLKPGEKITVSYVDTGKQRTVWYVYSGSAAMANPCGRGNPCAAKNPCAANPCAVKTKSAVKNPCAANPCAAKNPCTPKSSKGR